MAEFDSLSHTKWECIYHVVFSPKCRRKTRYKGLRPYLGEVFRRLAQQRGSRIEEGPLCTDHVHTMIAIPSKYAGSQVSGFIQGKRAIHLACVYGERKRNFAGRHFWARGYAVSTVGRDETGIRDVFANREREDQRLKPLNLLRQVATARWLQENGVANAASPVASSGSQTKAGGCFVPYRFINWNTDKQSAPCLHRTVCCS